MVSVIIPIYNVEKYLSRCLESIINQTYRDMEIILVDDGSTDESGRVCDEYAQKDSRIVVYHKTNGGLSDARNYGIDRAKGDLLTFVDSDDWVSLNYVEVLVNGITSNNADISIINTVETDENNNQITKYCNEDIKVREYSAKDALKVIFSQNEFNTSAWAKMYKKHIFSEYRFTKGILYEDLDLMYKCFILADKISFSTKAEYYYFQRSDSIAHEKYNTRHTVLIDISKRIFDEIGTSYPELYDVAEKRYLFSNLLILSKIINEKEQKELQNVIRANVCAIRRHVLKNKEVSKKEKVKTLLLILGLPVYRVTVGRNYR